MNRSIRRSVLLGAAWLAASTPAGAADIFKGRQIYATYCVSCHGPSGVSVMPQTPNFARGERLMQPDMMLLASVRTGRNAMPAFAGILTDAQILDVIAFTRTLR